MLLWFWLLIAGSAAAWVYTDAKAKGAQDPQVWAMLTMAVVGLPWWIVKRQSYAPK